MVLNIQNTKIVSQKSERNNIIAESQLSVDKATLKHIL